MPVAFHTKGVDKKCIIGKDTVTCYMITDKRPAPYVYIENKENHVFSSKSAIVCAALLKDIRPKTEVKIATFTDEPNKMAFVLTMEKLEMGPRIFKEATAQIVTELSACWITLYSRGLVYVDIHMNNIGFKEGQYMFIDVDSSTVCLPKDEETLDLVYTKHQKLSRDGTFSACQPYPGAGQYTMIHFQERLFLLFSFSLYFLQNKNAEIVKEIAKHLNLKFDFTQFPSTVEQWATFLQKNLQTLAFELKKSDDPLPGFVTRTHPKFHSCLCLYICSIMQFLEGVDRSAQIERYKKKIGIDKTPIPIYDTCIKKSGYATSITKKEYYDALAMDLLS